jgi:class 3 adenylate cyclase
VQAVSPLRFYFSLELKGSGWVIGFQHFFADPSHVFLLVLSLLQAAGLISLSFLALRQKAVIADLLATFKELSRWGFGARVVERVLSKARDTDAARVERCIGFIDIRGFTAWSEKQAPEQVIAMLNGFYEAVLSSCADSVIKAKMSADEVLLVLPDDASALPALQQALRAAQAAVQPVGLSAGAGAWIGTVVEGFFGARSSPVHDVIGDTVNTAKRLCDQAPAGILLAGPLARLPVALAQLPQQSLVAKGKAHPIIAAVWEVPYGTAAADR